MSNDSERLNWAAEEAERRVDAERIAKRCRFVSGSREAARERFFSLKNILDELMLVHEGQEWEKEMQGRRMQPSVVSMSDINSQCVPSVANVVSGEFDHPVVSGDVKMRRLCAALWRSSSHQSNPETSVRDLVSKCLLCLNEAVEWPPTAQAPPPPQPPPRATLLQPKLASMNGQLPGLKGSVVDVIRAAVNDRLVERATARDERQSRALMPPLPRRRTQRTHEGYGQHLSDEDSEYDNSDLEDGDESLHSGDEAETGRGLFGDAARDGPVARDPNEHQAKEHGRSRASRGNGQRGVSPPKSELLRGGGSDASSSSSSSVASSETGGSSASGFRMGVTVDSRIVDPSLLVHAQRLNARPRRLRERFDPPNLDANHSVMGTTALVMASMFEDIAIESGDNDDEDLGEDRGEIHEDSDRSLVGEGSSLGGGDDGVGGLGVGPVVSNGKMHRGVRRQGRSVAAGLLAMKAQVNLVDDGGYAALHAAATQGNLNTIKRLIKAGAHKGIRDRYGRRPDQVILEELPAEKHAAALVLLKDRPPPPPPVRMLESTPRTLLIAWNVVRMFNGEFPVTQHRVQLRIVVPPPVSERYLASTRSLSEDLVLETQALDGVLLRGRVDDGLKAVTLLLPYTMQDPTQTKTSRISGQSIENDVDQCPLHTSLSSTSSSSSQTATTQSSSRVGHVHESATGKSLEVEQQEGGQIAVGPNGERIIHGSPPLLLPGLVPNTTYGLSVQAENLAGISVTSLETLAATKGEVTTSPGCCFQVGMTGSSITIMWIPPEYDNGSPADAYEVRRFSAEPPKSDADMRPTDRRDQFFPELGASTRYRVDGDENFTQVRFKELYSSARFVVRAKNAVGWGPFSRLSPVMYAGEGIRVMEQGGTFIRVEWDTPPGLSIDRFEIQKRFYTLILKEEQYETLDDDILPTSDGTPVKFTIAGLKPGSKHQVRVRSSDAETGWRPWKTSLVSEVLQCAKDVPFPPTAPSTELFYTGGIAVEGQLGSGTAVESKEAGELVKGETAAASVDSIQERYYDDEKKSNNTNHSRFSAEDIGKGGSQKFETAETELPSIALSWTPESSNGSPIEEYEVSQQAGLTEKAAGSWQTIGATKATKFTVRTGLLPGQTYAFCVRARNSIGFSAQSSSSVRVTVFRVLPPAAPVVDFLQHGEDGAVGVTYLRLAWHPPSKCPACDIDSYELELLDLKEAEAHPKYLPPPWRKLTDIGGPSRVNGAGADRPTLILQGLLPGHRYKFRVRALAFEGWTDWSAASTPMSTGRRF